jgi:hypothetical protein
MLSEIIFGLIAMTVAIVFYLVPIIKLVPSLGFNALPLAIVVLIGVAMMIVDFIQTVRASREDGEK